MVKHINRRELELYRGQPVELVKKGGGTYSPTVLQGIIIEVREKDILFKETDGVTRRLPIEKISSVRMG